MLTHALLLSIFDLKAGQMNMQCSLIQELMLYEFQLGYNVTKAAKITCMKEEGAVDLGTVSRCFKKFRSGCKNLDDQVKSRRPKNVYSKTVLQAVATNPVSSTQRVSGELSISQSSVVRHLHDLDKSILSC